VLQLNSAPPSCDRVKPKGSGPRLDRELAVVERATTMLEMEELEPRERERLRRRDRKRITRMVMDGGNLRRQLQALAQRAQVRRRQRSALAGKQDPNQRTR